MAVARVRRTRLGGRRLAALTGAVVVASVAVSGCSPQEAGSAAVIGNQRIREATLQTQVRAADAQLAKSGTAGSVSADDIARDVLQLDIEKAIYTRTGDLVGIHVTPGEVSTARAQAIQQSGGLSKTYAALQQAGGPLPPSALDDFLYVSVLSQKLGAAQQAAPQQLNAALAKAEKSVKVKVNPRYGSFDVSQGKINPITEPWLRDVNDKLTAAG